MVDFIVNYNSDSEEVANKILTNLIVSRIDAGMPPVIIIKGASGTGKTRFAIKLQDLIYKHYGLDFAEYLKYVVLIKPEDWVKKVRPLIEHNKDPPYNNVKSMQMDEAKFIISADSWQTMQNKGIRTIIATSRAIKPFAFFILCQLLKDIDARTREQATYIFTVQRTPTHKPAITCQKPYEVVYDLNKILIKLKPLMGTLRYPDGRTEEYFPTFHPTLPRKELEDLYMSFEREDKQNQLLELLDDMEKEINKMTGEDKRKLTNLVDYFIKNPSQLEEFGKFSAKKGTWKFGKEASSKFNFTQKEFRDIEGMLAEKMGKNLRGDLNAMATESSTNSKES